MVTFQARIEAADREYRQLAVKGKETIDQLERVFLGVNCPQHPFHQVKVLVSFSGDSRVEVEIINSCCKKFSDLFDKKINEAMV
ncbi:MAG: hypothetical protein J0I84_17845 [Terrimonas sp.]|nr:hypothetical protein [Terrimonas sp.]OJY97929.1 MAG: hypothetical protein BGP13_09690 [Sphingobacteriales bacterium 40-81]